MGIYSYFIAFIEGILTFISPCILPLLPVYFFYMAGVDGDDNIELQDGKKNSAKILNSVGFVLGFSIIFISLGAAATSIGHILNDNRELLRKISGILMVVFGLNFIGLIKVKFLNMEKRINYKFKRLKFLSSIVFGIVFGFGWTPCAGAFLGSVLLMAGNSKTVGEGILLLSIYSLGLGIPFIISALLINELKGSFRWLQQKSKIISIISGIILIVAGVLVYTDLLKYGI